MTNCVRSSVILDKMKVKNCSANLWRVPTAAQGLKFWLNSFYFFFFKVIPTCIMRSSEQGPEDVQWVGSIPSLCLTQV